MINKEQLKKEYEFIVKGKFIGTANEVMADRLLHWWLSKIDQAVEEKVKDIREDIIEYGNNMRDKWDDEGIDVDIVTSTVFGQTVCNILNLPSMVFATAVKNPLQINNNKDIQ